ncbi:hypothetical protein ACGF0J_17415 [Nonomuraea sp. NPDC047897]|uniref:hypothetical protein n=1 Tax=Nonomuraea sp. NPDC047897 TaxID=3364346 RepID=UPI0037144D0E
MPDFEEFETMIGRASAARRPAELADDLLTWATGVLDIWIRPWREAFDFLRRLPADERRLLAEALADRYHSAAGDSPDRLNALTFLGVISHGLPEDGLSGERLSKLEVLTGQYSFGYGMRFVSFAEAELAAGRQLPPAVAAAFRRTALDRFSDPDVSAVAGQLTEPVLNVGEEWAERALAELSGLAAPWRPLLAHATTATAAKPSARWERAGRKLLDETGADTVRTIVLPWLGLVGRSRTLPFTKGPNALDPNPADHTYAYDPFNANALRGIAWLLSFLPPHPDVAPALGALVETSLRTVPGLGPRNPKVANAGVLALSRIDHHTAVDELSRLAAVVTHRGILKMINTAQVCAP